MTTGESLAGETELRGVVDTPLAGFGSVGDGEEQLFKIEMAGRPKKGDAGETVIEGEAEKTDEAKRQEERF